MDRRAKGALISCGCWFGFVPGRFIHRLVAPPTCSLLFVLNYLDRGPVYAKDWACVGPVYAKLRPFHGSRLCLEKSPGLRFSVDESATTDGARAGEMAGLEDKRTNTPVAVA